MICNFCNLNVTFSKSYKKEHSQSFKCMFKVIRMLFDICNFSGENVPISIKKVCKTPSYKVTQVTKNSMLQSYKVTKALN